MEEARPSYFGARDAAEKLIKELEKEKRAQEEAEAQQAKEEADRLDSREPLVTVEFSTNIHEESKKYKIAKKRKESFQEMLSSIWMMPVTVRQLVFAKVGISIIYLAIVYRLYGAETLSSILILKIFSSLSVFKATEELELIGLFLDASLFEAVLVIAFCAFISPTFGQIKKKGYKLLFYAAGAQALAGLALIMFF